MLGVHLPLDVGSNLDFLKITFLYIISYCYFSPRGTTAPIGAGPAHYLCFIITLRHTALDRTPLDE